MKKKYLIEFTHLDGTVEEVELTTDRLEWSIQQWSRNRAIKSYNVLEEGFTKSKQILFS